MRLMTVADPKLAAGVAPLGFYDLVSLLAQLDLVASLRALASAEYSAGQYEASRVDYERFLDLDRKLHGANHPAVADDLESLGSIQ
jgi:hypothetical protein